VAYIVKAASDCSKVSTKQLTLAYSGCKSRKPCCW